MLGPKKFLQWLYGVNGITSGIVKYGKGNFKSLKWPYIAANTYIPVKN